MWSPDGNTIAFIMGDGGTHYDIYTIQPDGSGLERITYSGTFWEDIFWLPDSLHIGYWSRYRSEDPERRFEVIDIISKEVVEIETPAFEALNQSRAYAPDWSLPPRPYIELPDCSSGWTRLVAGGQARVMGAKNDPPNRVRSEPAQGENIIGEISPGRIVRVTEGPVCVDGLVYWKVYNAVIPGGSGWTAEGDGTEYWLEPYLP
jgi:hypothetical protein